MGGFVEDLKRFVERWRIRLRWKLHLAERDAGAVARRVENRSRSLTYANRVCACGQLASADERRCAKCGRRLPGRVGQLLGRVVGVAVPESDVGATVALLVAVLALYALMLRQAGTFDVLLAGFPGPLGWAYGANWSPLWAAEPWRLVTSCFLHWNVWHVVFNVFALVRLGPLLEVPFGTARFSVLYLVAGVAGSLASAWWHGRGGGGVLSAGASGALCGLMGAGATYGYFRRGRLGREVGRYLVEWGVWVAVFGLLVGADNVAHAGGAAAGALLGLVLADRGTARRVPDAVFGVAAIACGALVVACFWVQWTRGSPWPWPGTP